MNNHAIRTNFGAAESLHLYEAFQKPDGIVPKTVFEKPNKETLT